MIRERLTTCFLGLVLVLFFAEIPGAPQFEKSRQQTLVYLPLVLGNFEFEQAPTPTATIRPTKEPTKTPTRTITRTPTPFRSITPVPTSTITPTSSQTPTLTFTPTNTATTTYIPLPVVTLVFPTHTPTIRPSPTPTKEVTASPTPASGAAVVIGRGWWGLLALICLVWVLLAVWLVLLLRRARSQPEDAVQD